MYPTASGHCRLCSVRQFLKPLYCDLHLLLKSCQNEYWKSRTAAGGYSVSCISCLFAVLVSFTGLYQQTSSKPWQNLKKKFPPLLRWAQWHHMCFCWRDTLNDTPWHGISAFPADAVYHLNTGRVSCRALPHPFLFSLFFFLSVVPRNAVLKWKASLLSLSWRLSGPLPGLGKSRWPKTRRWYICGFFLQKHEALSSIKSQVTLPDKTMASLCGPRFQSTMHLLCK